jgi:hypothetical protein
VEKTFPPPLRRLADYLKTGHFICPQNRTFLLANDTDESATNQAEAGNERIWYCFATLIMVNLRLCIEALIAVRFECAASQLEWHRCSRGRALNAIVRLSSLDDLRSNPSGLLKGHCVDLRSGSGECVERPAGTQV